MNIIGNVKGKKCIMIDDMIDMVGMIFKGFQVLIDVGVEEVYVFCIYVVLFGLVIEWLVNFLFKEVVVIDMICLLEEK